MKSLLTAEESAKLIELGVSPERASGICIDFNGAGRYAYVYGEEAQLVRHCVNGHFYVEECGIFTLADILDILPREIRHNGCTYKLNIDYPPIGMVAARYNSEDDDLDSLKGYLCEELIDALYSLLLWCLEKGYVKQE
jgi:hypothetical protein